jgi:hypothetical protein
VDNNFGVLLVRPTPYPQINDLSNVNISTVTGGDLLVYDGTDSRWENVAQSTITAGSATNLAGGATGSLPYQSGAGATTFLAAGTDGQVLKLASGVPTWSSDASGVTIADDTTTATPLYPIFTSATTGNATTVNVASTKLKFTPSTGTMESIVLKLNGTSSGYVGLQGAAAAGSTTYTLPSSDGTNGQVLQTNGSGVMSWATAATSNSIIVENAQTISSNYVLSAGTNGQSIGPVTISTGASVTVGANQKWVIWGI